MARKVTLFTGQWADLPFTKICETAKGFGYEGLELCCWGDHIELDKASKSKAYCDDKRAILEANGLGCWAISNHLSGQLVCDIIDERHYAFAPASTKGDPKATKKWAIEMQKKAAKAAKNLGIKVVNGFTGSPIWHLIYSFPPCTPGQIANGYKEFAKTWKPILDFYAENGIKFALEVHPTEIAFDLYSAERALEALGHRPEFGFNFDPSHLIWQGVNPAEFIRAFPDRIFHVHMKDALIRRNGRNGILGSHLPFGDPHRGWDFCSLGRGSVDFEQIIRALNDIGYTGPLSVEWEDSGMDREHGAKEACAFVRKLDFPTAGRAFDSAFER